MSVRVDVEWKLERCVPVLIFFFRGWKALEPRRIFSRARTYYKLLATTRKIGEKPPEHREFYLLSVLYEKSPSLCNLFFILRAIICEC